MSDAIGQSPSGAFRPPRRKIGKQIQLSWTKALEIAYRSLHVRMWRSLITMAGVILAIGFMMSIMANEAVLDRLRKLNDEQVNYLLQKIDGIDTGASAVEAMLLTSGDFLAPEAFICALQKPPNALAEHLRSGLTPDVRKMVDEFQAVEPPSETLKKRLAADLNATIQDRPLYDDRRFETIALKEKTRAMAKQTLSGEDLVRANRALLREAFPKEIRGLGLGRSKQQMIWLVILSLLVALIGIVNAMLMSVTERFREIGTMKCLGALDSFIVRLFLLESTFQGMVGTAIGILLGLAIALGWKAARYGAIAVNSGSLWRALLLQALFAFVVGTVISVLAAIYPAYRAARMAPVDAMRVDE